MVKRVVNWVSIRRECESENDGFHSMTPSSCTSRFDTEHGIQRGPGLPKPQSYGTSFEPSKKLPWNVNNNNKKKKSLKRLCFAPSFPYPEGFNVHTAGMLRANAAQDSISTPASSEKRLRMRRPSSSRKRPLSCANINVNRNLSVWGH